MVTYSSCGHSKPKGGYDGEDGEDGVCVRGVLGTTLHRNISNDTETHS